MGKGHAPSTDSAEHAAQTYQTAADMLIESMIEPADPDDGGSDAGDSDTGDDVE